MDLIFFDLDGTLLNDASEISPFTKQTLELLSQKNIAYTLATGRTMHSAQCAVEGNDFELPQIFNNGVTIWDPKTQILTLENLLTHLEISVICEVAHKQGITAFINVIDNNHQHIFHGPPQHDIENELINTHFSHTQAKLFHIEALPSDSQVTNISMIGKAEAIHPMWHELNSHKSLVAYSGMAQEGDEYWWLDVHHRHASKGAAVTSLKKQLGASNVICFGDGDNDLSMFALADESYAPENAKVEIKESATAVIGHNHEDGIARFLRERFSL